MKDSLQNSGKKKIQAVRGMDDLLPARNPIWRYVENSLKQLSDSFGYSEIRTPIVEKSNLFKRAVGEVTDIVEKEMYTFYDRNEESLTLRPELTAGCVRAGIEHGLLYNQEQRLWYLGSAFRYERPQKGRYRQFHQFGVEVFGLAEPDIEVELILIAVRLWRILGLDKYVVLELNSIGQPRERADYRQALIDYLETCKNRLDADALRRLYVNPLRILDSKDSQVQALLNHAPKLLDYLDDESKNHFDRLCRLLDSLGVKYRINPRLVRGLDYYNRTVFEWVTSYLGAQNTVCAGGRYDRLVEQLGGQPTPAAGFAIGIERLVLLTEMFNPHLTNDNGIDIYIIVQAELVDAVIIAQSIADQFRDVDMTLKIMTHRGGGSFKKQFTRANKWRAKLAIVLGENEVALNQILIKNLSTGDQMIVDRHQVVSTCLAVLNKMKGT